MNNHTYHQQYLAAMQKLHGQDGRHVCEDPDCSTLCLGQFCYEHLKQPEPQPEDKNP